MAEEANARGSPSRQPGECQGGQRMAPPQPHPRHRRLPPEVEDDEPDLPPSPPRTSPPPPAPEPRLSQLFDRLSHLTELTHNLQQQQQQQPQGSPRLLPRRARAPMSPPNISYGPGPAEEPRPSAQQRLLADLELLEAAGAADVSSPALLLAYWAASGRPAPGPPPATVDWQQRCVELELELHQFRMQAGRVRDLLRDKLAELESRLLEAESRADEAEDKVRSMEQRLAAENPADWSPSPVSGGVEIHGKEKEISRLESQVEEQRLLRLQDAKQVEAKAAKIKEWVTNKLRELEEQNQQLREQNQKCTEQLDLLRNHLSHLGRGSSKDRHTSRASLAEADQSPPPASLPPDLPARPASASSSSLGLSSTHGSSLGHRRSDSLGSCSPEPMYLDAEHGGGRRRSRHQRLSPGPSTLTRDLHAAVASLVHLPAASRTSPCAPSSTPSLPAFQVDDGQHDYAEIYTPSKESVTGSWGVAGTCRESSGGSSSGGSDQRADHSQASCSCIDDSRPPTPPLHRFPSWESKIYQIADEGFQLPSIVNGSSTMKSDSTNNNTSSLRGHKPGGYIGDISVPVYATVKGRASQIRSMPFTGDSSDSSDGEDGHNTASQENTLRGVSRTSSGGDTTDQSSGDTGSNPSKSLRTSMQGLTLSPAAKLNVINNSASPSKSIKRAENCSMESATSEDYAIPPDALSCCESTSIESSMPSLVAGRSNSCMMDVHDTPVHSANSTANRESLEKQGYLTKLGGKLKTWRKRWFVLKNGVIMYWKSQNDVSRKPQGHIELDDLCRVTRADGAATFEISTGKKTYYLTADSIAAMEDWIRVLQNVQRRNATKLLLHKEEHKPTIQGWLTKVKNGHTRRCWCVLIGKMFMYFKGPTDTTPLGQINMRDARVEEVDHVSDSDSSEEHDGERINLHTADLTIALHPSHQGPTYLIMPAKQDKDTWMYHLTVVSGGGSNAGTQYEQLVQRLMEVDGDPTCVLWRHPLLLHTKDSITSPLTTLPREELQGESLKLFKSCQLFMSVPLDAAGIDYHVVLAQNALQQCLTSPELQAELLCGLMKQTSRHLQHKIGVQQLLLCATQSLFLCDAANAQQKASPTSQQSATGGAIGGAGPTGAGATGAASTAGGNSVLPLDCKANPPSFVFIQGWQLLALAVSLFLPRNSRLLWFLRLHLARNADSKTECGKYAAYCQRALERTLANGAREARPSRMEVLSILLKNPYHHSLPHAIPVHMLNGTYQVVSFDGSTTVEELLASLVQEIGCRDVTQSGFTLSSDDPIDRDLEHYVAHSAKVCDVISKWEVALREKGSGKFENSRAIKLSFKSRLWWRHNAKRETDKERLLLCYQCAQQAARGRLPLNRSLALEMAALMAQIDMGEYPEKAPPGNPHFLAQQLQSAMDKFLPARYRDNATPQQLTELHDGLAEKWIALRGRSVIDCVRIYLTCARKWPYFGTSLYQAKMCTGPEKGVVWMSVGEDAVTILELGTMALKARYPYTSVVTFGGCQDDFMLVVSREAEGKGTSQRLLFALSQAKILEVTLLIADYMNALGQTLPGTPQTSSLTRHGSHRSQRSRAVGTMSHCGTNSRGQHFNMTASTDTA
ncbi:uncharacterized protein CG43867 isoform X5 [Neocloeon triangulifer]|uniref:uncharacterized protein CG43867 isoform X5 n=1 Tax=Neocloeon triangulifer TaxID=2078957 RepID=UPI00286F6443|nr:uncharacterized protein CG43867 isoform X5 [Neocloeon triangulifer]